MPEIAEAREAGARTSTDTHQLRYYIALSSPPTRCPADGTEPFMRPEVGFTPRWFHEYCGIDFSETWHEDPDYRLKAHEIMTAEVRRRFPGRNVCHTEEDVPADLLTGLYAGAVMPAIMGVGIRYWPDAWPAAHGGVLSDEEADALQPVDLDNNAFFQGIMRQCDRIEELTGTIRGFLNWQGVLNTTFRLRGEEIFTDMLLAPERARHVFDCVAETMLRHQLRLNERQRQAGEDVRFATISNCVVNMVSGEHYREFLLPYDLMLRSKFEKFGIHNCAWVVDAYMEAYAETPDLGYIDMGVTSDLVRAKELFPNARRNLLYTAMDMKEKTEEQIREDFEKIAREYAPCDLGLPNVDLGISDDRVKFALDLCAEMTEKHG
jgi:hypothetical protein